MKIKELVSKDLILCGPRWKLPFHISTDAFNTIVGEVLGQQEDNKWYAMYYISKNLTPTGLNYTVTKK